MDGEPPQEEDFSQIPIVDRSQHKVSARRRHNRLLCRFRTIVEHQNWKARVSAYTEVISKSAKTASDSDPFFRPYVSDGALL